MKKRYLLTTLALALAGAGAITPSAKALSASNGDLFLGFYATSGTGSTKSLLIDIGQASTYRDFTGTYFDLSIGDIGADLVDTFGSNWYTRPEVKWGVFGTSYNAAVGSDGAWTLYAGRAQTTLGSTAQEYNQGSAATQSQPASRIQGLLNRYVSDGVATANSSVATIQDASISNDFAEYQTLNGGQSFSYFINALADFTDGGTTYNGATASRVDLFRMVTGPSSTKGTYEGTFTISNTGTVSYGSTSSFAPVPEPSTYGIAIGVALVGFAIIRRRNALRA